MLTIAQDYKSSPSAPNVMLATPIGNALPPLSAAWSVEELDACFVVKDRAEQKLAYFEDECSATKLYSAPI